MRSGLRPGVGDHAVSVAVLEGHCGNIAILISDPARSDPAARIGYDDAC